MKLTYQTAIATFIQFVVLGLLNIATGASSVISSCHKDGSGCFGDAVIGMFFFLLICGWFGSVWALGIAAQAKRSRLLAISLIFAELLVGAFAAFSLKHHNKGDYLSIFTSFVDGLIAIWVIVLAFRLARSGGGRVVVKQRARRRPTPRV